MSAVVRTAPDDESEEESGDSSSFTNLPDEMVLQILRELIDLKTLCVCKLVCKRFSRHHLLHCSIYFQLENL